MRIGSLFFTTLREDPADAEMPSHRLLLRAGYIRPLGAGIYSLLPLGMRVNMHVTQVIREEMNAIGAQEMLMPVVHPADLWRETGRYDQIGPEMGRFQDRGGRDMVLAMTHEEVVTDLLRKLISSWRQLPQQMYHFQTKWRDEPRSRGGLIRVREFTMKDAYSADRDEAGLDHSYKLYYHAYTRIFARLGLKTIAVASDVGMMGGSQAHEFMAFSEYGEDTLVICDGCNTASNRQVARVRRATPASEAPLPLEEVKTPDAPTIEALAKQLGVGPERTAKAVFFADRDARLIVAIVRGDDDVEETKLTNAIGARDLRPARDEEIRAAGMVPGYASPIGAKGAMVVVDELVAASANLVAGANNEGYHVKNVNIPRDFTPDHIVDIASAKAGDACLGCGGAVRLEKGIEVGNIFKLGTRYSAALGAEYADDAGVSHPIVMGSYGIGVGRAAACIAEAYHDEKGLAWPAVVAPFDAQVALLGANKDARVEEAAVALERAASAAGIELLVDDRTESPGVKFADAELLGAPWTITISPRSLDAGGAELTRRADGERSVVPLPDVLERITAAKRAERERIEADLASRGFPATYQGGPAAG
ncbi:MAG: proline--tRNA ligase [Chloroflexi bacterium]|nr:MAG: proline--tRNA ligase [Chloroflexota bacterium]